MRTSKYMAKIKPVMLCLFYCLNFCLSSVYTVYASTAWPNLEGGIDALAGIVIDMNSETVLYEENADTLYPPASTTKVLTAMLVLENCVNLDDMITFSREATERVDVDSGNRIGVEAGDQLTVRDCLHALILSSSNQAANALAEYIAGDIDTFVIMMNDRIRELGLTQSHFDNPSGLNGDTQYVTARELALIAKAAYEIPGLLEISARLSYQLPAMAMNPDGLTIRNEHRLVYTTDETSPYYYPPAIAGKTGFLMTAGNTLITYAEQDGKQLISIVLKGTAGEPRQYFIDGKNMLEFGFSNFTNYNIHELDKNSLTEIELAFQKERGIVTTDVSINTDAILTLPNGASFDDVTRNVTTNLPSGHPKAAAAMVEYTYNDNIIGRLYIETTQTNEDNINNRPLKVTAKKLINPTTAIIIIIAVMIVT